jgi:hypothetical protein
MTLPILRLGTVEDVSRFQRLLLALGLKQDFHKRRPHTRHMLQPGNFHANARRVGVPSNDSQIRVTLVECDARFQAVNVQSQVCPLRFQVESVAFLFKDPIIPPAYRLGKLFFPSIVADASAMEKVWEESGLDWTIARPPELTGKPHTGNYRVREGHLPSFGFKVSRADVPDFMIKAAENRSSVGKIVGISN